MYIYKSVLTLATLQFDGHYLQYLIENSEKLVALYLLPRGGGKSNFYEVYQNGVRIEKKDIYSPKNLFFAYVFYYVHLLRLVIYDFHRGEKFYFINFFWFFHFFSSVIKKYRNIQYVYWIGDYWPMDTLLARVQQWFIHYYHDKNRICLYLSDRINKEMNNGILVQNKFRKTSMWGINPPTMTSTKRIRSRIILCHIGVLVDWQGIDLLLALIAKDKRLTLNLIGTGNAALMTKYTRLIKAYNISERVYFPNKFFYGSDLYQAVKESHIGIALYTVDNKSVTYYADPAKIKQYAEFGLPIVMTDTSGIAEYINKFRAGIVVERHIDSIQDAIYKIKDSYGVYLRGLNHFNHFFNFRRYYKKIFGFMEED